MQAQQNATLFPAQQVQLSSRPRQYFGFSQQPLSLTRQLPATADDFVQLLLVQAAATPGLERCDAGELTNQGSALDYGLHRPGRLTFRKKVQKSVSMGGELPALRLSGNFRHRTSSPRHALQRHQAR